MSTCHGQGPDASGAAVTTATRGRRVLLVGNPNVGKSTLFNGLTRARQRVMNAPGTTVELQTGSWRTAAGAFDVVDLPGTYSLVARSPDEAVVADALAGAGPDDVVVVVLDATALARSLYLLAQVARDGRPVVVGVTMLDVAAAHGTPLDRDRLEAELGVPVVPLDPRGTGGRAQLERMLVEGGVAPVEGAARAWALPRPHAAATLAPELAEAESLFAWVEDVTRALAPPTPSRRTRSDVADRLLLNPWVGLPVFLATMWALFELATSAAAPVMDLVGAFVDGPLAGAVRTVLGGWAGTWVEGLVVDGVLAGVGTVATFVPLMAIMYTALSLLEDSGYMARAAFLADRAMRSIGLDGRAMLPLIIGFGCNVPAIAATRTIPDARQRLLTGLLVPWTSCAARLTVYVLLAGAFFPDHAGTAIFGMYVLSIVLVVLGGLALRRSLFRDLQHDALLLVLPAYQRPRLRSIAASVWSRVRAFTARAGGIIVVTLTVVWVLMAVPAGPGHAVADVPVQQSLYGRLAEVTAPVFAPAGLDDWHVTAALATGFVAKEVVVGSLAQSFAVEDGGGVSLGENLRRTFDASSDGHGAAAALALMVFVLGYTPCLATVAEQRRSFGLRWTVGAVAVQLVVAWVLAVVVFQVGRLL